MGKVRRGGFVFFSWKGDHGPRHVHVYKDGELIVKWDVEHRKAVKGKPTQRILELISELQTEGLI